MTKTALITGGASLMGQGVARCLIDQGWQVVIADLRKKRAEEAAESLGKKAGSIAFDVCDRPAIAKAVQRITEDYGAIDGLVNLAGGIGIVGSRRGNFVELTPDDWEKVIIVNLGGTMNVCHAVLPGMIERKSGVIVSVSASRGLKGGPKASHYSAAKAGIIAFTQSLAQEVGPHGIRVNTFAPGSAESYARPGLEFGNGVDNRSPLGRRTSKEDIGELVAFVMSDKASHITGSCLDVSGGASLY
jgi:NAD(P)-dependent dehydrogenase (short-subunit alcohol dehydrogenase family)